MQQVLPLLRFCLAFFPPINTFCNCSNKIAKAYHSVRRDPSDQPRQDRKSRSRTSQQTTRTSRQSGANRSQHTSGSNNGTAAGGGGGGGRPLANSWSGKAPRRPFFVTYVMVVQTVVMLAVLATTELAPTTLLSVPESFDVESVSGINLVLERNASQNVFIGPAKRDVIRLGAMYPPCMRADAA